MDLRSGLLVVLFGGFLVACDVSGTDPVANAGDGTNNNGCDASSSGNVAPSADAGASQSVTTGDLVTLDASKSSDLNCDTLTYAWTAGGHPGNRVVELTGADTVSPTFTPEIDGAYNFSLVVTDSKNVSSNIATVTITASSENVPPIADAGQDQNVMVGRLVSLDGSGSYDRNNDDLDYTWSISAVPAGSIVTSIPISISFLASFTPDIDGDYVFALTVNDGTQNNLNTSKVTISANSIPKAVVVGADQIRRVATNSTVVLDGSASSDATGDTLTYKWSIFFPAEGVPAIPSGSNLIVLNNMDSDKASFVPDVDGGYTFTLIVNDGLNDSLPVNVSVFATSGNIPPVADAGKDRFVKPGAPIVLDGSRSYDDNPGDGLTYEWSITKPVNSPGASLSDTAVIAPTFIANNVGVYEITLTVKDNAVPPIGTQPNSTSLASTIIITVSAVPIADIAVSSQRVETGSTVRLDGSNSIDPEPGVTSLFYDWRFASFPAASNVSFTDASSATPQFTPNIDGLYKINLVVNNGVTDSNVATVSIFAATIQGTAPIPLDVIFPTGLPLNSWVARGDDSYYRVDGLSLGTRYDVSISGLTENADLKVYADDKFNSVLCESGSTRIIESCDVTPLDSFIYIKVLGTLVVTRADYTLNIVELNAVLNPLDEGTLLTPVPLLDNTAVGLTYNGTVGNGDSFYIVSNISAGVPYIVRVTGLTEDAELYVYDSAGIKVALCASTGVTTSEICEVTTTGNTMLVRIDGERVTNGTGFTLDVFQK